MTNNMNSRQLNRLKITNISKSNGHLMREIIKYARLIAKRRPRAWRHIWLSREATYEIVRDHR